MLLHGIKIIYEDADWVVVHKPAGVMSQRGQRLLPNVLDILSGASQPGGARGKPYLGCVHRLDTNVSGVMAVAKHPAAARHFQKQLKHHKIQKIYTAVVESNELRLFPQVWLNRGVKQDRKLKLYSYFETFTGPTYDCRLEVETLERVRTHQLIQIRLITGAFHQIRAQCAQRHMPIVGDQKYGGSALPDNKLLLHATELRFQLRPNTEVQTFTDPLPTVFKKILRTCHSREGGNPG